MIKTRYIPCFFVIMTRKTTECYSHVFRFIEEKAFFKLEPTEIITDFELGMRKAIRECYPAATLHGCWYHYNAALRKKMLQNGLHRLMEENPEAQMIKKMMMALPLLPSKHFEAGYSFIKQFADVANLFKQFEGFFAYFDDFWVNQVIMILNV